MRLAMFLTAVMLGLSACGKPGGGAPENDAVTSVALETSLFSKWKYPGATGVVVDLENLTFGQNQVLNIYMSSGAHMCGCAIRIVGDESQGSITVGSCGAANGCQAWEDTYSYQRDEDELELCPMTATSCETFERL